MVAVEGLCLAGKTTLVHALATRLGAVAVPEYADLAALPPWPPHSREDVIAALQHFLGLEQQRVTLACRTPGRLVALDRSPLTLIAHEYGMGRLGVHAAPDLAAHMFSEAAERGLIFTPDAYVYLRVPASVSAARQVRRGRLPAHLTDPAAQAGIEAINSAYLDVLPPLRRVVLDGRAVIAKYPTDRRPFWLARARHEITVYRALPALAPLPVTVPDMVAADPRHPLIVIAALNGDPVHPHRYLTGTIHNGKLDAVLSLLARVHTWRPAMPSALPYDDDYPSQLAAVRGSELSDIEHSCAVELYTAIYGRLGVEIQHGDAHLGNVMCQPDGRLALIDLEFTAWRWPGYDLAMLWTLLGDAPGLREQLIPRIGFAAERHAAFWCSAVLVCLREITSHRRGPQAATCRTQAKRLQSDLVVALDHVQTYHRQIV